MMNEQTGAVIAVSSPVSWTWQEISTEEWEALSRLESARRISVPYKIHG